MLRPGLKSEGVTLSAGLLSGAYSRARSHYCPTRELLAARFPSWPFSLLLRQPGSTRLLKWYHVDARLSADTCSTQATIQQDSQLQASHYTKPPGSRITGTRHIPGERTAFREQPYRVEHRHLVANLSTTYLISDSLKRQLAAKRPSNPVLTTSADSLSKLGTRLYLFVYFSCKNVITFTKPPTSSVPKPPSIHP